MKVMTFIILRHVLLDYFKPFSSTIKSNGFFVQLRMLYYIYIYIASILYISYISTLLHSTMIVLVLVLLTSTSTTTTTTMIV